MVVHCSYSIEPFFCSKKEEFIVIIKVYGAWIKHIELSTGAELVGSGGYNVVGKLDER